MAALNSGADNDTLDGSAGNDLNNFLISMGFHSISGGGLGADTMLSGFVPGYTVYMVDNPNDILRKRDKIVTGRRPSRVPFILPQPSNVGNSILTSLAINVTGNEVNNTKKQG